MEIKDLPVSLCQSAYRGTSFSPEKRGQQTNNDFKAMLESDFKNFEKLATTPEKQYTLENEWPTYESGYRAKYTRWLEAKSRCLSPMITGPANFPTRRNEKANNSEDNRYAEMAEFRKRAIKSIEKKLCPELAPIMAGDGDAVERLEADLKKRVDRQTMMKAVNKILRKKKGTVDAKMKELIRSLKLSEEAALATFEPDCFGCIGFAH